MEKEKVRLLFEIVDSELRMVVNEYDDNTGRIPSKKRMEALPVLKSIREKLTVDTAVRTTRNGLRIVLLDYLEAVNIDLTPAEKTVAVRLVKKYGPTAKELLRELG